MDDGDGCGRWPTRRASEETTGEDEEEEWTALLTCATRQESIIRVPVWRLAVLLPACLLRLLVLSRLRSWEVAGRGARENGGAAAGRQGQHSQGSTTQ